MNTVHKLITNHIDIWAAADNGKKSRRGRNANSSVSVYGIKKLRELILDLAVRGKLLPQDPNDEPASELLKRIQAEKAKLIANGKIKKNKSLSSINVVGNLLNLPQGWEVARLGQLGDWGAGATPLRSISEYYGGKIPWFKSGELTSDFIDISEETITDLALKDCSLRLNQPGDVLIAMYGATIGKVSILKIVGTTNQAVCACTPYKGIFNRYLLILLKAMRSDFIKQGAGGAQPNISREKIIATIVAIPPIAEQHRIVAKVDEFMALCDQMEAQHINAAESHENLVTHLLDTLLIQSANSEEFNKNWQRIAAHFDILFTTETSVEALKQTLLQLAVMGKLVTQDHHDEPASELLNRIQAEKAKLIAEGKIKKGKSLTSTNINIESFKLPNGWELEKLGVIAKKLTDGSHNPPKDSVHGIPMLSSQNINFRKIDFTKPSRFVSMDDFKIENSRTKIEPGDILLTIVGTLGRSAVVQKNSPKFVLQRSVAVINTSLVPEFLCFQLCSSVCIKYYKLHGKGTAQKGIYLGKLSEMPILVPPFAEQNRIVAKVDELLSICDQLKAHIIEVKQLQQQLADIVIKKDTV